MYFLERCEYRLIKRHYRRKLVFEGLLENQEGEYKKNRFFQPQVTATTKEEKREENNNGTGL